MNKSNFLIRLICLYWGFSATDGFSSQNSKARNNVSVSQVISSQDPKARNNVSMTQVTSSDKECNRRSIINQLFMASSVVSTLLSSPTPSYAAQTAGEAVRRGAANIPGYGSPDVYYPSSFLGKWKATRTIAASDDPMILNMLFKQGGELIPINISYDVRFITVDGDEGLDKSKSIDKVIADRQFNELQYYNALKAKMEEMGLPSPPSVQNISWSPFNPNVCTSTYNDGSTNEIKVTKRAAELDTNAGLVSSSEYRRVTTTKGAMGIPSISASRVLTKWKTEGSGPSQVVDAIEIVYSDGPMGGDPMIMGTSSAAKPQLSSKSRLRLERPQ